MNIALDTSPGISLYVCSSTSLVPEIGASEAAILVDHGTKPPEELSPTVLETPLDETVTMQCGGSGVLSLTWKKETKMNDEDDKLIAFTVLNNTGDRIHKVKLDGFELGDDNSLVVKSVTDLTVGVYACVYSDDGITTSYLSYEVTTKGEKQLIKYLSFKLVQFC